METKTCRKLFSLKSCIWTIIYTIVLFEVKVEATGYGQFVPIKRNICSQNCTKWKPKHCWDGYLKRKIWKMVCEKYDIQCCPGYDGPKCENECFSCDKVNTIERRIVDIYGRIQAVEDKCTNSTVIIHGGGGSENTDDKYTKECTCPAGPRGDMGPQGPAGLRGEIGPQGRAGAPGQSGNPGRPGQKGERGEQGFPGERGLDGEYGADGLPGLPGQKGDPGLQGLPGPHGLRGEIGPEGPAGSPGSPGRVGRPGLPGSASAKGEPGLPGRDGLDGNPGRPGRNGEQGDSGIPGLPGQKGDRGIPGPDGIVGLPGGKGERGEAGILGRPGYPGNDGATGPIGPEGPRGEPGRPGRDGRPGDITKVEESRVIQTLQNTIQNLATRLETVTKEVEELRIVCNGIAGCRFNCTDESFKCSCGMCIPSRFRCDGFPQCPDGSDELEEECDYICDAGEFKCESSGLCIPVSKQCNGVIDCSDGSDESSRYCSDTINCNEGNVPCRDGSKCVAREERCDGKADCSDGSDEESCDCGREEYECASQDECIPRDRTCDNIPDCTDGSDESPALCQRALVCSEGRKACDDESACLNIEQFCDGIRNCFDGSDEKNCELRPTQKPTTRVDNRTETTTPSSSTTTTTISLITEEEIEGSGDLVFDRELCKELHAKWSDPRFPGGDAPPLHPGSEINQQLCNYMLLMAKESCGTGAGEISQNVELCKLVKDLELPSMNTRQKRHKHHKTTDDEELLNDGHYDASTKEEDISFDETDIDLINKVEIEPVALAYSSSSSSAVYVTSLSLVFTCIFVAMVN